MAGKGDFGSNSDSDAGVSVPDNSYERKSGILMGIDADGKFELLSGIFYGNYTGTIVDRKLCSREVDL